MLDDVRYYIQRKIWKKDSILIYQKLGTFPTISVKGNSTFIKLLRSGDKNNDLKNIQSGNNSISQDNIFQIDQYAFTAIYGAPFAYWISDNILNIFKNYQILNKYADIKYGFSTGNNDYFYRYHWEIKLKDLSKKWYFLASGGDYNKYYGNNELVVNWEDNGHEMRNYRDSQGKLVSTIRNKQFHFQEGLSFSKLASKGFNIRYLPKKFLFDAVGICFFPYKKEKLLYFLGFLNSILVDFFLFFFNSAMTYTGGDVSKIPFKQPSTTIETHVSELARQCINNKKIVLQFIINDREFKQTAIQWGYGKLNIGD